MNDEQTNFENPEYKQSKAAELKRQELERKEFNAGFDAAKDDIAKHANAQSLNLIELEEKLKTIEQAREERYKELLEEQQRRMDLLEIRYRGPPSERER